MTRRCLRSWWCVVGFSLALSAVALSRAYAGEGAPPAQQPGRVALSPCDQVLKAGEVTIRYQAGLEAQAKEIAVACPKLIQSYKEKALAASTLPVEGSRLADLIATRLGVPEQREALARNLAQGQQTLQILVSGVYQEVRLYREAEVKAAGGLTAGGVTVRYDPATDRFTETVATSVTTQQAEGSEAAGKVSPGADFFLLVLVKDDGSFRPGGSAEAALRTQLDYIDECRPMVGPVLIHEAAEGALLLAFTPSTPLGDSPISPFTRWFYEGAAHWAALEIIAETAPDQKKAAQDILLPTPEEAPLRERINLLSWALAEYGLPGGEEAARLDVASYRFAAELMSKLLEGMPPDTLARVVQELKGSGAATSDVICEALRRATGREAKQLLFDYVPASVKQGLAEGLPEKLLTQAKAAAEKGDPQGEIEVLSQLLEMTPEDADSHLQLAIAMRRKARVEAIAASRARDDVLVFGANRHIVLAAELIHRDARRDFQVRGAPDEEAWYALALAEDLRGRYDQAWEFVEKLPPRYAEADPLRADLREFRALREQFPAAPAAPGAAKR